MDDGYETVMSLLRKRQYATYTFRLTKQEDWTMFAIVIL